MVQKEEAQIKTSQTPLKSCELQCVVSLAVHRPLGEIMSLSLLAHTLTSLLYSVTENREEKQKMSLCFCSETETNTCCCTVLMNTINISYTAEFTYIENKVTAVAEAQRSQPHLEEDST